MDVPADVLNELKCSRCELYLARGPVYLQHDESAVCGQCFTPERPATRNKQYEATAKLLKFPCKNRELGCLVTVPFADESEVIAHEAECEHRQYVCPVLGSARCDWLGPRAAMLAHCRDQHPDSVLENPCSLIQDISEASLANYIITAFQVLFLLHTKVCVASGKIYLAVRFLGRSLEAAHFIFHLDIKRNNKHYSEEQQVAPQGTLAIEESTSLSLDINSLLGVLGSFDGATFTVTLKRRVVETCAGCSEDVTMFQYRGEDGWRCERCAPARRPCKTCTHTDIDSKCSKHEDYFCQQRILCIMCWAGVSQGSLSAHYGSAHQDITHSAGSTWRATQSSRWCLVASVAGTAVCWYWLTKSQFVLYVFTPASSERLSEFRCEVLVTDPATGHTRTFTPGVEYDKDNDWLIQVDKDEFPWNTELDVCVDIKNCDIREVVGQNSQNEGNVSPSLAGVLQRGPRPQAGALARSAAQVCPVAPTTRRAKRTAPRRQRDRQQQDQE